MVSWLIVGEDEDADDGGGYGCGCGDSWDCGFRCHLDPSALASVLVDLARDNW